MFSSLCSVTNEETLQEGLLQQWKFRTIAIMWCYHESTPCAVSKDKWDTKENTGNSTKHIHCGMPKGTSWAEVMSNSEKTEPVALAVIELHLAKGNS